MKQAFRQYRAVAAVLACILVLSLGLTVLTGGLTPTSDTLDDISVLATTYPLYVAAQNIIGDGTAVTLTSLEGSASGCLHDYQMSPSDRRAVQEAELILINGAGAESFLNGIVDEAKCVDTSAGLDLLCTDHDHGEGEVDHLHEEYNEHVWLSPARYIAQVGAVRDALMRLDPEMAQVYSANAADYQIQIAAIQQQMEALAETLKGCPCVLFHDSMAYLAADLGLDVRLTLSVEGESGLSAADLKEVEALAAEEPNLLLLYDTQYAIRYEGVGGLAVSLNTVVIGEGSPDDWVNAMTYNINRFLLISEETGWSDAA